MTPIGETTIVTGASGWLGRALVARLTADGRRLRLLVPDEDDAVAARRMATGAAVVVGDVRDPVAVDRLFAHLTEPTVFHLAAVIHPRKRTRELFDVNVGGTMLVADRTRRTDGRMVHVSSNSPFGVNASPDDAFDESSPYDPWLGYGRSKAEAERVVLGAVERGLDAVIVRCPWLYGPHQPARQTSFFEAVGKGRFPLCGNGRNRRSMAYTEDLADGLVLADAKGQTGRAYWIADERPYEMVEVLAAVKAALIANGLPVSRRQLRIPGFVSEVAVAADRAVQGAGRYVAGVHVLGELNKTIACRIDRARTELGYDPQVGLGEGMRRSVAWCLQQGMLT